MEYEKYIRLLAPGSSFSLASSGQIEACEYGKGDDLSNLMSQVNPLSQVNGDESIAFNCSGIWTRLLRLLIAVKLILFPKKL
ncbi:MAG: hypothetical protein LBH49_00540 [Puniceicoccales bacterium]|nr:hypothetical protein [Puniceicoccales bacterium]